MSSKSEFHSLPPPPFNLSTTTDNPPPPPPPPQPLKTPIYQLYDWEITSCDEDDILNKLRFYRLPCAASERYREHLVVGTPSSFVHYPKTGSGNCVVASSSTELKISGTITSFTWRNKGVLSEVPHQGMKPICWIYATISSLEARVLIDSGEEVKLSRQQLLDGCCQNEKVPYAYYVDKALKWIGKTGLVQESKYQWIGSKGSLRGIKPEFELFGVRKIYNEDKIKSIVSEHPVPAVILYPPGLLYLQKGDIHRVNKEQYHSYLETGNSETHAVMVVGWLEVDEVPVWEAQNSYGNKYCDDGYFYIVRESGINRDLEYNPLCEACDVDLFRKKQA